MLWMRRLRLVWTSHLMTGETLVRCQFSHEYGLGFIRYHRVLLSSPLKTPVALWDGWEDVRAALTAQLYFRTSAYRNFNLRTFNVTSRCNLVILILVLTIRAFYELLIHLFPFALVWEATLEHARGLTPPYPPYTRRGAKKRRRPHFLWQNTHTSSQPQRWNCVSWALFSAWLLFYF